MIMITFVVFGNFDTYTLFVKMFKTVLNKSQRDLNFA